MIIVKKFKNPYSSIVKEVRRSLSKRVLKELIVYFGNSKFKIASLSSALTQHNKTYMIQSNQPL